MRKEGYWGSFADAAVDLRSDAVVDPYRDRSRMVARILLRSQKFFFPEGAYVLEGRLIDDEVKRLVRLPADSISVLWECDLNDENGAVIDKRPVITIALDLNSKTNQELKFIMPNENVRYALFSVIKQRGWVVNASRSWWVAHPYSAAVIMTDDAMGYRLSLYAENFDISPEAKKRLETPEEFQNDASVVLNLCALLGTKIARAEAVEPPIALNKARAASSKALLQEYHVLRVGNELWDRPAVPERTGDGGKAYRSHFRRGHIRNLGEGKFTWVRHTIVTGARGGFVDKEYHVQKPKSDRDGRA